MSSDNETNHKKVRHMIAFDDPELLGAGKTSIITIPNMFTDGLVPYLIETHMDQPFSCSAAFDNKRSQKIFNHSPAYFKMTNKIDLSGSMDEILSGQCIQMAIVNRTRAQNIKYNVYYKPHEGKVIYEETCENITSTTLHDIIESGHVTVINIIPDGRIEKCSLVCKYTATSDLKDIWPGQLDIDVDEDGSITLDLSDLDVEYEKYLKFMEFAVKTEEDKTGFSIIAYGFNFIR